MIPSPLLHSRAKRNESTHQNSRQENQESPATPPSLNHAANGAVPRRNPKVFDIALRLPDGPAPYPPHPVGLVVCATPVDIAILVRAPVVVVVVVVAVALVLVLEPGSDQGAVSDMYAAAAGGREQI